MYNEKKIVKSPLFIGIIIGSLLTFASFYYLIEVMEVKTLISFKNAESIIKLILAAIAGSVIGFERENKNRPAGLRTHSLVCIGAAIAMIIPIEILGSQSNISTFDVTRMGAQVISGVGFLGAGTILRNGFSVKGLTTAASLWVVAIIGLAIGGGLYITGIGSTLIILLVLKTFGSYEYKNMTKNRIIELMVDALELSKQIRIINTMIATYKFQLVKMEIILEENEQMETVKYINLRMIITTRGDKDFQDFYEELQDTDHIIEVEAIN